MGVLANRALNIQWRPIISLPQKNSSSHSCKSSTGLPARVYHTHTHPRERVEETPSSQMSLYRTFFLMILSQKGWTIHNFLHYCFHSKYLNLPRVPGKLWLSNSNRSKQCFTSMVEKKLQTSHWLHAHKQVALLYKVSITQWLARGTSGRCLQLYSILVSLRMFLFLWMYEVIVPWIFTYTRHGVKDEQQLCWKDIISKKRSHSNNVPPGGTVTPAKAYCGEGLRNHSDSQGSL